MKIHRKIYLISLTIVTIACQSKISQQEEIVVLDDSNFEVLKGQELHCVDTLNSYVDIRFFDKYILVTERNRENHFVVFDVSNSCVEVLRFLKRGEGPDEFGMPFPINASIKK